MKKTNLSKSLEQFRATMKESVELALNNLSFPGTSFFFSFFFFSPNSHIYIVADESDYAEDQSVVENIIQNMMGTSCLFHLTPWLSWLYLFTFLCAFVVP